MTAGNELL